uniref:Uncharacterized protein n=1 Tax=Plectus sambesii TaxID=2011161 RepID=A0A914V3P5_9BILA
MGWAPWRSRSTRAHICDRPTRVTIVHHGHSMVFDRGAAWSGRSVALRARPASLTGLRRGFTGGKWCTRDDGHWPPGKSHRHSALLSALASLPWPGVMFRRCARRMTLSCRLGGRALCNGIKRVVDAAKTPPTEPGGRIFEWPNAFTDLCRDNRNCAQTALIRPHGSAGCNSRARGPTSRNE